MAIDLGSASLPAYKSEAEVYAAKSWLKPGSVRRDGPYWVGIDATDNAEYIVGRLDDSIVQHEAGDGYRPGSTGLAGFMLTKTGDYYGPTQADGVQTLAGSGGAGFLPGFGTGNSRWLLWLVLIAGVALYLGGKGRGTAGKALRARFAAR